MNWIEGINWLDERNQSFVLVTVLNVEGSAPRDTQTKMVVWSEGIFDTIGGGNLEYQAIARSRQLLCGSEPEMISEWITLGKDLSQCCGGKVELMFEYFPAQNVQVVLLGAGHVAQALVKILSGLEYHIHWIDTRKEIVESLSETYASSRRITLAHTDQPEITIEACPDKACYLVMSHSHELDIQYVEAILSRKDAQFCGLIGSRSKAAKFRNRLKRKNFTREEIDQMVCPIGLSEIPGKKPAEVAVSIAAQLIQIHHHKMESVSQENLLELVQDV